MSHMAVLSIACCCVPFVPTNLYACCFCGGTQVRSDCPPRQLVEFLVSDTGVMADQVRSDGSTVAAQWRQTVLVVC